MPRADQLHYNLLTETLHHYVYAVENEPHRAEAMRETARCSIALVRQSADEAGDRDLSALCDSAERVVLAKS